MGFVFLQTANTVLLPWNGTLKHTAALPLRPFDPMGTHGNPREMTTYGNYCISTLLHPFKRIKSLKSGSLQPAFAALCSWRCPGAAPGTPAGRLQPRALPRRHPAPAQDGSLASAPASRIKYGSGARRRPLDYKSQERAGAGRGAARPRPMRGKRRAGSVGGGRSWRCPGMTPSGGAGAARSR